MKKNLIPSIVLYIFAVLLAVFVVWSFSYYTGVIKTAVEYGQITLRGNLFEILSYYMDGCGRYFVYMLLLAGLGVLLQRVQPLSGRSVDPDGVDDVDDNTDSDEEDEETDSPGPEDEHESELIDED